MREPASGKVRPWGRAGLIRQEADALADADLDGAEPAGGAEARSGHDVTP